MPNSCYPVSCCAVQHELYGVALIAVVVAFSVAESGFGVSGKPVGFAGETGIGWQSLTAHICLCYTELCLWEIPLRGI